MVKTILVLVSLFSGLFTLEARADLIQTATPLVGTSVLTISADISSGGIAASVAGNVKQVGSLYDSLDASLDWDPVLGKINVAVGTETWSLSSPSFVGAPANGFSVKSSDWSSFLVFSLGATNPGTGLTAYVTNPYTDISYLNTEGGGFEVVLSFIPLWGGDLNISLNSVDLSLNPDQLGNGSGSGSGGGTVPEPTSLLLAGLALFIAYFQRAGHELVTPAVS